MAPLRGDRRTARAPAPRAARRVGDRRTGTATVAVCTLTDHALAEALSSHPRVAVARPLATANLGIDQLVTTLAAHPEVSTLVICGTDSPLFRQGQSLLALAAHGCRADGTILGAQGYRPRLSVRPTLVEVFRRRVVVLDRIGVTDVVRLGAELDLLPVADPAPESTQPTSAGGVRLVPLPAGGRRSPINRADGDFFVVSVDRDAHQIVLQHYHHDLRGGHELRSHSAEALLLAAIRHDLVDELSHAGYLGTELGKAETALRLGLRYVQDRPLR
ncbi:hypothetical protein [Micromonospora sp. NPDC047134]|uniref:DUF4346 domain-containing protein n=1 Tax=Micromonospora sp. NPDC047134 TaxID=3154340 RepID=UPI0033EFD37B